MAIDECTVLLNFTENHCFLVRDAVKGYPWNNGQRTLHSFAACVKKSRDDWTHETTYIYVCVISDCLKHDTTAVHTSPKAVILFLQRLNR